MSFYAVDFGTLYAGLSTVGYTQKKADGTDAVARTTTGVVALGNGCYGVSVTPNAATVVLKWDTGGSPAVYAHESISAPADVQWVRGQALTGTGVEADPWGPA